VRCCLEISKPRSGWYHDSVFTEAKAFIGVPYKKERGDDTPAITGSGVAWAEGEPLKLKAPTAEQLWSCLKRCLSFEEPVARSARLRDLIKRHILHPIARSRTLGSLCQAEQDRLFKLAFGMAEAAVPAQLLSIVLALEDVSRFSGQAFDRWLVAAARGRRRGTAADPCLSLIAGGGRTATVASLMAALGYSDWARAAATVGDRSAELSCLDELELGGAQAAWVARAALLLPDWGQLRLEGPWSSDSRAGFLVACLDALERANLSLSAIGIERAQKIFLSMLGQRRAALPGSFLPALILLVEGPTEALLLPHFARCLGFDLDAHAVMVVAAGGANQVLRRFLDLRVLTTLPIAVVLDGDAREPSTLIAEALRKEDRLHILSAGEIEDVFDQPVFLSLLNDYLRTGRLGMPVQPADLQVGEPRTGALNRIWRKRGLGDFDKIGFARTVAEKLTKPVQVPADLRAIVRSLQAILGESIG